MGIMIYVLLQFDWLRYFQIMFAKTNYTITEDQEVVVLYLDDLKNIIQLLSVTTNR